MKPQFDATPVTERAARYLIRAIAQGEFGNRLPQEGVLAADMGISRLTLREVVKVLEAADMIAVERGRGTFVRPEEDWDRLHPAVFSTLVESGLAKDMYRELTEFRRVIEMGSVTAAAIRRDRHDLAAMHSAVEAMTIAADQKDVEAFAHADLSFHDALIVAARNPFATRTLRKMSDSLLVVRAATTRFNIGPDAVRVHMDVLDAIEKGEPNAAILALDAHFANTQAFVESAIASFDSSRSPDGRITL